MKECPNCGTITNILTGPCGCTWTEQILASRENERRRRKEL